MYNKSEIQYLFTEISYIFYHTNNKIMDLNKAQIIGRITQDLELKQTPNGQNVLSFSVATNRNWTDWNGTKQEQVEFHNVVLWGKLAEIANQYLKKWSKIYIEWRIQTRSWEAQDGSKRYKTEIVWEHMIMLDSKPTSGGYNSPGKSSNESPAVKKSSPKAEEEISIEDIPF
jgi:single-strand DNA-binding protein